VAGGVGFTAIIVSWLARLNPIGILLVAFLFSILEKGSSVMQSTYGISTYSANVIQGIILFFVLACEFFIFYKFILGRKGGSKL
jgi:simple sugar transport system permease protein